MKQFVPELWYWLTVFLSLVFLYAYLVRWIQTMGYSKGHRILGLLGVASVAVCVIVYASPARPYVFIFTPIGGLGLASWLLYNNWFFSKYPILVDGLRDGSTAPRFVDHFKLLTYLSQPENPEVTVSFFAKHFRLIALIVALPFAFGFGFYRVVYYIHEGDQRVAATIAQSARKSDQTVQAVKHEFAKTVQQVADTLRQGQVDLAEVVDSNTRKTSVLTAVVAGNAKQSGELNKKVDRMGASVERNRRSSVFVVSPIQPVKSSPVLLPTDRVKPLPAQLETKPRRKKVSYEEVRDSVINYASGRQYSNQEERP